MVRGLADAQPFYDKADFEQVKRRAGGIDKWIEDQLKGTSVTVVLFGAETYDRPWVRHEIKRSYELGKGLLAIDIHNVKHPRTGVDVAGRNPLSYWQVAAPGGKVPMSSLYPSYDWVRDNGYANIADWIEKAATAAGK